MRLQTDFPQRSGGFDPVSGAWSEAPPLDPDRVLERVRRDGTVHLGSFTSEELAAAGALGQGLVDVAEARRLDALDPQARSAVLQSATRSLVARGLMGLTPSGVDGGIGTTVSGVLALISTARRTARWAAAASRAVPSEPEARARGAYGLPDDDGALVLVLAEERGPLGMFGYLLRRPADHAAEWARWITDEAADGGAVDVLVADPQRPYRQRVAVTRTGGQLLAAATRATSAATPVDAPAPATTTQVTDLVLAAFTG